MPYDDVEILLLLLLLTYQQISSLPLASTFVFIPLSEGRKRLLMEGSLCVFSQLRVVLKGCNDGGSFLGLFSRRGGSVVVF